MKDKSVNLDLSVATKNVNIFCVPNEREKIDMISTKNQRQCCACSKLKQNDDYAGQIMVLTSS